MIVELIDNIALDANLLVAAMRLVGCWTSFVLRFSSEQQGSITTLLEKVEVVVGRLSLQQLPSNTVKVLRTASWSLSRFVHSMRAIAPSNHPQTVQAVALLLRITSLCVDHVIESPPATRMAENRVASLLNYEFSCCFEAMRGRNPDNVQTRNLVELVARCHKPSQSMNQRSTHCRALVRQLDVIRAEFRLADTHTLGDADDLLGRESGDAANRHSSSFAPCQDEQRKSDRA